jgi:hypothetical protein
MPSRIAMKEATDVEMHGRSRLDRPRALGHFVVG